MRSSQPLLLIVATLAAAAALTQAGAAPLDGDTCKKLKIEQNELENAGVEQNMAKGPKWAKANLAPEKLEQVRRFIELEELIVFRCRGKTLVTLPAEPDSDHSQQDEDKDKDKHKQPKDPQGKGKQETIIRKTAPQPPGGGANPPGPAAKADPRQKPQAKTPVQRKAQPQPAKRDAPAARQPANAAGQKQSNKGGAVPSEKRSPEAEAAPLPGPSLRPSAQK